MMTAKAKDNLIITMLVFISVLLIAIMHHQSKPITDACNSPDDLYHNGICLKAKVINYAKLQ